MQAHQNDPLPSAIVPALATESILAWRKAYRSHRLGGEHGAKGQGTDLLRRFKSLRHHKV